MVDLGEKERRRHWLQMSDCVQIQIGDGRTICLLIFQQDQHKLSGRDQHELVN